MIPSDLCRFSEGLVLEQLLVNQGLLVNMAKILCSNMPTLYKTEFNLITEEINLI